jgi:hypothetical protein
MKDQAKSTESAKPRETSKVLGPAELVWPIQREAKAPPAKHE